MIRLISSLTLLASLALSSTAAERRVLFAVLPDEPAIEPIVLLDPIEAPREETFPKRYFDPSRSYTLSMDGKAAGTVRPAEKTQLGCVSIAAKATIAGDGNFATNFEPAALVAPIRGATDEEIAMLRRWARLFLVHHGIAAEHAEGLEAHIDVVDPGDGDPLFVGSFTTLSTEPPGGAAFVIVRVTDVTATRVVPQLALFNLRDPDGNSGVQPLFGAIDLDGDGSAELVTQRQHKEGYDYFLYRRLRGRWTVISGGGSGC